MKHFIMIDEQSAGLQLVSLAAISTIDVSGGTPVIRLTDGRKLRCQEPTDSLTTAIDDFIEVIPDA